MTDKKNILKPRRQRLRTTERDYLILKSLWKWKLLSTTAIATKFFSKAKPYSAYIRLLRLQKSRILEFIRIEQGTGAWSLAPLGFGMIRGDMVELEQSGFKSENTRHDHLVTAFHLGEWLVAQPSDTQTFSEQQLRRISKELWPPWIPQSDLHRPDGYTRFIEGSTSIVIAFEVELHFKGNSRYDKHTVFYDSEENVSLVLWLVRSEAMIEAITRALVQHNCQNVAKHQFITLRDFQTKGWEAQVAVGSHRGRTLLEVLPQIAIAKQCCNDLLNTKKRPDLAPTLGHQNSRMFL